MVKLTIQLPDDVYAPLADKAKRVGRTPEEVAVDYVSNSVSKTKDDPLFALFGSIHTDLVGVFDEHDKHIGEGLMNEMRDNG